LKNSGKVFWPFLSLSSASFAIIWDSLFLVFLSCFSGHSLFQCPPFCSMPSGYISTSGVFLVSLVKSSVNFSELYNHLPNPDLGGLADHEGQKLTYLLSS
jgi:hypothetical protein